MSVYLDTSVVLAKGLDERPQLSREEWEALAAARVVSSRLIWIESLRALDRLRLGSRNERRMYRRGRAEVLRLLRPIDLALLEEPVLALASQPMPSKLRTLDAIHLATALMVRSVSLRASRGAPVREDDPELRTLATHDPDLAEAARGQGFQVLGA